MQQRICRRVGSSGRNVIEIRPDTDCSFSFHVIRRTVGVGRDKGMGNRHKAIQDRGLSIVKVLPVNAQSQFNGKVSSFYRHPVIP